MICAYTRICDMTYIVKNLYVDHMWVLTSLRSSDKHNLLSSSCDLLPSCDLMTSGPTWTYGINLILCRFKKRHFKKDVRCGHRDYLHERVSDNQQVWMKVALSLRRIRLVVLAVLITRASQSTQHGMSEPIPPVLAGSWERIPNPNHLITLSLKRSKVNLLSLTLIRIRSWRSLGFLEPVIFGNLLVSGLFIIVSRDELLNFVTPESSTYTWLPVHGAEICRKTYVEIGRRL
ncbi:hypothetical protein Tco_1166534 [Tanacetum coccineum]